MRRVEGVIEQDTGEPARYEHQKREAADVEAKELTRRVLMWRRGYSS